MSPMEALDIVDFESDANDEERLTEAWQYLIDSGMAWTLPGRYGRQAAALIEAGICTSPSSTPVTNVEAI